LPSPKPPPSPPPASSEEPCFPSSAVVTLADGTPTTISNLREGDSIVAATADGALTTDTVSLFSLANKDAEAMFALIVTDANNTMALTPTHHMPVGASCCSTLKQAIDVSVGDTVWIASAGAVRPQTVAEVSLETRRGLHSPLLTHGTFPLVDGFVTSFNSMSIVAFDGLVLPFVLPLCKATSTCSLLRHAVAAAECAYKSAVGSDAVCKRFKYIDGLEAQGGKGSGTQTALVAAVGVAGVGALKLRA